MTADRETPELDLDRYHRAEIAALRRRVAELTADLQKAYHVLGWNLDGGGQEKRGRRAA